MLARYLLHQLPGWVGAALIAVVVVELGWLPLSGALLLVGLVVFKDFAFYPWMRAAYLPPTLHGPESLRQSRGRVVRELAPEGLVRVGPELWRARRLGSGVPVPAGTEIEVRDVDGLVLVVEPSDRGRAVSEEPAREAGARDLEGEREPGVG